MRKKICVALLSAMICSMSASMVVNASVWDYWDPTQIYRDCIGHFSERPFDPVNKIHRTWYDGHESNYYYAHDGYLKKMFVINSDDNYSSIDLFLYPEDGYVQYSQDMDSQLYSTSMHYYDSDGHIKAYTLYSPIESENEDPVLEETKRITYDFCEDLLISTGSDSTVTKYDSDGNKVLYSDIADLTTSYFVYDDKMNIESEIRTKVYNSEYVDARTEIFKYYNQYSSYGALLETKLYRKGQDMQEDEAYIYTDEYEHTSSEEIRPNPYWGYYVSAGSDPEHGGQMLVLSADMFYLDIQFCGEAPIIKDVGTYCYTDEQLGFESFLSEASIVYKDVTNIPVPEVGPFPEVVMILDGIEYGYRY